MSSKIRLIVIIFDVSPFWSFVVRPQCMGHEPCFQHHTTAARLHSVLDQILLCQSLHAVLKEAVEFLGPGGCKK